MQAHEKIIDLLRESTSASDLYNLTVAVENFDVPQARLAAQKIMSDLHDSPVV